MSGLRTLDPDKLSLRELVEETLYTTARVRQSPEAKSQLSLAESMLAEARLGVRIEEDLNEKQIEADAGIVLRNLDLDAAVAEHRAVITKKTHGKTDHKLYQRFYAGLSPHEIIRLGLRTELPIVEPWVESLKNDADLELKALAAPLEMAIAAGRAAIEAQDVATQAMRDFRAAPRAQVFDKVNAGRRLIWAELAKLNRGVDFALSFFRPQRGRPKPPELTLADAESAVAAAEAQLQAAQKELAELKQRESEAAAQAAAREEAKRALKQAEAEAHALAQRIATLREAAQDR